MPVGDPMVVDGTSSHAASDAAAPSGDAYRDILIDGFVTPSTSVAPMFPFYDNFSVWDGFGEVATPDDFVIKEEDMDHASMVVDGDLEGKFDEGAASLNV